MEYGVFALQTTHIPNTCRGDVTNILSNAQIFTREFLTNLERSNTNASDEVSFAVMVDGNKKQQSRLLLLPTLLPRMEVPQTTVVDSIFLQEYMSFAQEHGLLALVKGRRMAPRRKSNGFPPLQGPLVRDVYDEWWPHDPSRRMIIDTPHQDILHHSTRVVLHM